jgi:hypothetical protein
MKEAIPKVFTHSVHRNCFFHIKKKAVEKCARTFATNPNLHADFTDILNNSLTEAEFESLWPQMIHQFNCGHVKYFAAMWKARHRFVPVYFKRSFFPFIHSTARSEGTNSVFKDNVGSTYSVISFLSEYERIVQTIEEKEREADSITRTTKPTFMVRSEVEFQAARMYNRQIFYKFQKQLMFTPKLHVDEIVKGQQYEVYKTRMLAQKDFRTRRYTVTVNLSEQVFSCICCKFEKDGIVCSHILRVLVQLNMSELPEKYFIERWKPKEKKNIRDKQYKIPVDLTTQNRQLRFHNLSKRLVDMASEGAKSNDRYLLVVQEAMKIEDKLDEIAKAEELKELAEKAGQKQTSDDPIQNNDGYGDNLENPDVAKSKGRPNLPGRQKTFMEDLFTKQKITCSHCGSNEHNIATCKNLHLPKTMFAKEKKKAAGKAKSGMLLHQYKLMCLLAQTHTKYFDTKVLIFVCNYR